MDSLLNTAARALSVGDVLGALKCVALREDAPALALRGIALAQLGELTKARQLLRRAARGFGASERVARARCAVAEAEVALAANDLPGLRQELRAAAETLAAHGDPANALFARLVEVRWLVLSGRLVEAQRALQACSELPAPPRLIAIAELVAADIAQRALHSAAASAALERALRAARAAGIPALVGEVETAQQKLAAPAARLVCEGRTRLLSLAEVEAELAAGAFLVDACRREVRAERVLVSLISRPVLFALLSTLAEAAPGEVSREALIQTAFGLRRIEEPQRVRLRVELGRLRKMLGRLAQVTATKSGFVLRPALDEPVRLLLPPDPDEASSLVALLGNGGSWSTSGLAEALGKSQRAVQRALKELEAQGKVRAMGRGRSQRWVAPPSTAFATTLLLVARGSLG
jgi:DNA-binding winged helix-turn-helix (wHTH) protein